MLESENERLPHPILPPREGGEGSKRERGHSQEGPHFKKRKIRKWRKCNPHGRYKEKCKVKKAIRGKAETPFNSTQFIMEEHDCLNDSDLSSRPRRHRDSSFSVESEDLDEELSSTEEEEEFITQQFWCAYQESNAERLNSMSKSQLVQEFFALEDKLTHLERDLREARELDRRRIREPSPSEGDDDEELTQGEVPVDAETAAKIEIFRNEIQNLHSENEILRQDVFRKRSCRCSPDSSSSSSSSSSSCESEPEDVISPPMVVTSTSGKEVPEVLHLPKKVSRGHDFDSGIASSEGVSCGSSGEDKNEEDSLNVLHSEDTT